MTFGAGPIQVVLADRHSLFVRAVHAALSRDPDLTVVAEACDGSQALSAIVRSRPDVAVLGANLLTLSPAQISQSLRERDIPCRVVVVADTEDLDLLYEAVLAGTSGYVTKVSSLGTLSEAIRAVHRGETYLPRQMLGDLLNRLIHRRREQEEAVRVLTRLTRRERDVLALLVDGGTNEAIGRALVISPETARTHIQKVLSKLGVHSRLEAVAFVTNQGVLDELQDANPKFARPGPA